MKDPELVELILVRHGESIRNHATDMARHGDPSLLKDQMLNDTDEATWPLTEAGHHQAQAAGQWIHENLGSHFDAAYVSPFVRTQETANDLGLDVDWVIDDRIREREWGDYLTPGYPEYSIDQYLKDLALSAELTWKTPYPGSESVLDLVPRVTQFLQSVLHKTHQGRIVAVTHGGTIRAFQTIIERLWAPGTLSADHRLSNCCVVMYRLQRLDVDKLEWEGEVRTAHPALPGDPETPWQPVDSMATAVCPPVTGPH